MLSMRMTGGNINVATEHEPAGRRPCIAPRPGIERARAYLNLAPADDVPAFLTRLLPSRGVALDDVPEALDAKGQPVGVGAVLNDGTGPLVDVAYPPSSFGREGTNTALQMGNYTVWIRNDTADIRRGNFLTDTNGAVVIRSRCVAPDGRNNATVELTFFPRGRRGRHDRRGRVRRHGQEHRRRQLQHPALQPGLALTTTRRGR